MIDDPNTDPVVPAQTDTAGDTPAAPEQRDVPEAEKKFVQQWCSRIKAAKEHNKKAFERMDFCMQLAKDGADKEWLKKDDHYVVPIVNRLTNQSVSQLYAKNPKALAKRSQRRMFTVWDGTLASLKEAADSIQQAAQHAVPDPMVPGAMIPQPMPPDPNMLAIMQDAQKVKQYDILVDGIADTLTILHNHFMKDQSAQYKQQFKALVRRTKVCCVGYVKLGFQRILEKDPDVTTQLDVATEQHATLRALMEDASRDNLEEDTANAEQLRTLIEDLQARSTMIVQEGPVLSFPKSKKIIIDPACTHLKTLAGAGWTAEEYEKTPDEVMKIWAIDITGNYTEQKPDSAASWSRWSEKDGKLDKSSTALVWRVMNRDTGQEFVVCDGHDGYLQPPAPPKVKLRRFFDLFPLVFNEIESEEDLYPPSDVWLTRHLSREYNRTREGLREHRLQNRPGYIGGQGTFEESDLLKLSNHDSGAIILLQQLATGEKITDKLQAKPVMTIDPKMYEVESIYQDILRVVGSQQADIGQPSGKTATESSIAEQSHSISVSDNVDDLDDMLSLLAQATGELMLQEMSKDMVVAIVGPGAVWPESPETRQDIIEEITLETHAGSSGRPNAAADLAKMERAMPFVLQLPGINPVPWGQRYLDTLDVDVENAIVEGLPSITATNAIASAAPVAGAQPGTGDAANNPAGQGPQGAQNAPQPPQTAPGPQPGFPAPTMRPV